MTDEEFEQQNEYEDSLQERIKELEEENENKSQLGLALYTALAKELEKQGLTSDIPSVIDQLVGKNCGKYADMYNKYKSQQIEIEELKIRITELEDKDWYEACIKQLENQNDRLIKEVEELKKDVKSQRLATDLYATIASTNATEMTIAKAVRKQVCDEVRNAIFDCRGWHEQGYVIDMREEDLLKEIDKIEQAEG